jgi:DNA-binding HxlR family transcriptional regulator
MRYGQFCPIAKAAEILAERWMPLVVYELIAGSTHFNDIRRGVPLMSPSLLSQRLKQLERAGIVEHRDRGGGPRRREWILTEAGQALAPLIYQFADWGLRYAQEPLQDDELDAAVLMWNMRRRVSPNVFGPRRTTVEFHFSDAPPKKRRWWLVNHRGAVDLCLDDPGFPVDIFVATDMRTMIAVWFSRVPLKAAIGQERIELTGPRSLCALFESWLLLSPVTLKPQPGRLTKAA